MVPKGLVHPQGHPWSLAGSEVVDWLGSRIFPSRTAGLYRVLDLEEIGKNASVLAYSVTIYLALCWPNKMPSVSWQCPTYWSLLFFSDVSTSKWGKFNKHVPWKEL